MARSESRRLWLWVKASPLSLRVLSFVSGFFMFVAAVFGMLSTLFSGHELTMMINVWMIFFSLVIMIVDMKSSLVEAYVVPKIEIYAQVSALCL